MVEELENRKGNLKKKLMGLLKNKYALLLIGILIFAFVTRIYFFSLTAEQTLWWDEADYMGLTKKVGKGILPDNSIKDIWSPRRPFLMPLIWSVPFLMGFGEKVARFSTIIIVLMGILLTYLVGKEMFNKKVGLIAAFGMSVFYLSLFLGTRFLVGLPGTTFWLATVYCLWKGYVKKERRLYVWLIGVFFGLTIFTKANSVLLGIPLLILFITKDKLKFLKNKDLWISFGLMILTLAPFIIWLFLNYVNPAQAFTGVGQGRFAIPTWKVFIGVWVQIKYLLSESLGTGFLIAFVVGLVIILINLILGFDLIFKENKIKFKKYLFIILWIMTLILFFGYQESRESQITVAPRYLIYAFPAVFMIVGKGLLKIYDYVKRCNKYVAVILILGLLFWGMSYQMQKGNDLIENKLYSYGPVKQAALWIKENSEEKDIILSVSKPQTIYYSERYVKQVENVKEISKSNARYMTESVFERAPDWFIEYPLKHSNILKPVQAYYLGRNQIQPVLIIYEFINH